MALRLGFNDNRCPIYAYDDADEKGDPHEGAQPLGFILYRDPTAEEEIEFNREFFAAVTAADNVAGGSTAEVCYRHGQKLVTGGEGIEVPAGADLVKTICESGFRHIVGLAQRAFLIPRHRIDMGKPESLRAGGSAESSAESGAKPASTSPT